ncbi:hypothetical protein [Rhodococcus globerulus]|uniref:Uncharacterized protein n=1 Tax=Rhodococcus globerulus TaxID=33008 RepID=A0ABU4C4I6_RHOGO|nr:hypothetical protein [Rhodococcus globerulus]MDV6271324.1 hypothetical protein [Rhodococcus globerulus]
MSSRSAGTAQPENQAQFVDESTRPLERDVEQLTDLARWHTRRSHLLREDAGECDGSGIGLRSVFPIAPPRVIEQIVELPDRGPAKS